MLARAAKAERSSGEHLVGAEREFGAPDGALMESGRAGQESWWEESTSYSTRRRPLGSSLLTHRAHGGAVPFLPASLLSGMKQSRPAVVSTLVLWF